MLFFCGIQWNAILMFIANYYDSDKGAVAFVNLRRNRLYAVISLVQVAYIFYVHEVQI